MAIQPNKPQNRVFLLVGIVLAALAAVAVLFAVSRSGGTPSTSIVTTKVPIAAGTTITADMLTTTPLPNGAFPPDSFTDPQQVVGKTAPLTISPNTPLNAALFAATATTPGGTVVAAKLDITKGYVAMAIPVSGGGPGLSADQMSLGYYIQPEDHIDILIDPGVPGNPGVRYSFQDVRVLRVGTAGTAAGAPPTVYIVELPRNQAEILTALTTGRSGSQTVLKYVLRPSAEYGQRDGKNGFDKPNYVSNQGGFSPAPDTTVTPALLNQLFAH